MAVPTIELSGIAKSFAGVQALDGVDFRLESGEIHALMGENGAGKSTLVKIMTGALARDAGLVHFEGKPVEIDSAAIAQALGIGTVYQEINLVPSLSVAQNLTLGRQPRRWGLISWRKARERARAALARLNLDIDVERPLASYSVALQQLVALARAIDSETKVLVLDEPTASLDRSEVEQLFGIMRELRGRGIAILFITHFIDQVYEVADRISVLRNGRLVGTAPVAEMPRLKLISLMLGRELALAEAARVTAPQAAGREPVLAASGLGARRYMAPFDLTLGAGEVVGLAGLLGSGRTETAKLLYGALKAESGVLRMDGRPVTIRSPRHAVRLGIGFCPEDRKREGLVAELTVRENIVLALQSKRGPFRLLPREAQRRLAEEMIAALGIVTRDGETPVGQLSGGNQQKVILARWLASQPRLLILDEPTRGIDVGAHAEIIALIRRLCAEGLALLVASSELDELVAMCTRVAVLRDRRKVAEIGGEALTRDTIIRAIAGG
ncbi:MAG: sugar ABC transporter ATP-binding protein [Stellaceae bacterium]